MRLPNTLVGRIRSFRGRCPSCSSEGPGLHSCQTCMGYPGPFPASEDSQRRWAARFARTQQAGLPVAAAPAPRGTVELFPVR